MTSSGQGADFQSPHSIDRPKSSNFYFSELIFRAQVLGCFLVCEYNNSLVVIDLHAAHERINYNQIRKQILQRKVVSQLLLIPEVVEVGSRLVEDYLELRETLENCGFEIDTFGADRLVIRAVPSILANKGLDSIIKELLNAQAITELKASFSRIVDYIAARLACHASLRSGDIIKAEEAQALFHLLDNEELGAACPHGRPVLVNFLRTDVESWFGRDK
jgi:DNA mismatch repair protein MutL